jgi:pyruvate dehydrogenase E2 component (dihydrolipoamide acetyltransferase)
VIVPKWGMTMESGTLVRWLKSAGEAVAAGEPIVEIESDKLTGDVESPAAGRLGRLRAAPGDLLPVGAVLCQVLAEGESEAEEGAVAATAPETAARLTPAARRVARELALDPAAVAAAFPSGRVTREEVAAWAASQDQVAAAAASPAPAAVGGPLRRPLTPMRATIARRMQASLQESAQLTLFSEADVTALVSFRTALLADFEREHGHRPTYTDFLIVAMARAVAAVPQVNARWAGDAVELLTNVDVGVAVALDEGLIVPVIRGADRLALAAVGRQVRDLSERARRGELKPGEASGSTISLTNLGGEGIDGFTPILNPPEVAILGIGRIRTAPALVDGALVANQVMTLSLTIDHRVIDGLPGARYLRRVTELLAEPALLVEPG